MGVVTAAHTCVTLCVSAPPPPPPRVGHLHIHRPGVEKQLQQLNPTKASGPDEIPPRLLKLIAHEIAPALSFLYQQSYNTYWCNPSTVEASARRSCAQGR